jgi:aspartate kinase
MRLHEKRARRSEQLSVSDANCSAKKFAVLKVGGSVLTGNKAFRRVALFLKHRCELKPSERLVVVVSAQKSVTDSLECRARRIVQTPSVEALDLLWSTGELGSVALLTLHLQALKVLAIGLNVHQTGLRLSSDRELCLAPPSPRKRHLGAAFHEYAVVVVPGFLATSSDGAIVSVGRGGSDLSAVVLAIGLRASHCELVKDVPGYFEKDPHENRGARHLPSLTFEKALRMADRGCELVQQRALRAAAEINLPLVIRGLEEPGLTTIVSSASRRGPTEFAMRGWPCQGQSVATRLRVGASV